MYYMYKNRKESEIVVLTVTSVLDLSSNVYIEYISITYTVRRARAGS
jgi:hypothetical protein